jgi:hypothetical protein
LQLLAKHALLCHLKVRSCPAGIIRPVGFPLPANEGFIAMFYICKGLQHHSEPNGADAAAVQIALFR